MKKKTINAFTLVEMLIVIVIIGILIAALMPRMQAAQGRARDVSRKTALSQIQSAIVTAQGDLGSWPGCSDAQTCTSGNQGMSVEDIGESLKNAGMSGIPKDPLGSSVEGLGSSGHDNFAYLVLERNGTPNGGFALMAKTEVAGGSNWVICPNGSGKLTSSTDVSTITLCQKVEKSETDCITNADSCSYTGDSQLRYLVIY